MITKVYMYYQVKLYIIIGFDLEAKYIVIQLKFSRIQSQYNDNI